MPCHAVPLPNLVSGDNDIFSFVFLSGPSKTLSPFVSLRLVEDVT
jgi:hypothetical protein